METDMERLKRLRKRSFFLNCQVCDKTVRWTVLSLKSYCVQIISHTMFYTGRFAGQKVNRSGIPGLSPSPLPKNSKKLQKKY